MDTVGAVGIARHLAAIDRLPAGPVGRVAELRIGEYLWDDDGTGARRPRRSSRPNGKPWPWC
ncbi:hypothetical protein [Streptomyces sp. H27-D2]|uniref:hypothetical protein n=1 Tax=Streptomyces sp. H27-D2 TaxID=3046304 RepID=UPI002DB6D90B|nr:hypothetical protein [Streptomyces sp. H27-D2]MEC4021090.1 hypothetical protein [Streptomyces sp. H27-D2]